MAHKRMELHAGRLMRCYAQRPANVADMLQQGCALAGDAPGPEVRHPRLSGKLDLWPLLEPVDHHVQQGAEDSRSRLFELRPQLAVGRALFLGNRFEYQKHAPVRQVRMPAIDEFPPQVKKQIEAQQSRIESIAEHAQHKKPGLFQRLANVGLGRKDDPPVSAQGQREPSIASLSNSGTNEAGPAVNNKLRVLRPSCGT